MGLGAVALAAAALLAVAAGAPDGESGAAAVPEARWFLGGRTVTRVLMQHEIKTERTPSSCVVVAPSLPPCRSARALSEDLLPTGAQQILATYTPIAMNIDGPAFNDEAAPFGGLVLNDHILENGPALEGSEASEDEEDPAQGRTLWRSWIRSAGDQPVAIEANQPVTVLATPAMEHSRDGWNFRIWNPDTTVTKILKQVETQKHVDPKMVITFSVTGCQPSKLPFDLNLCDEAKDGTT